MSFDPEKTFILSENDKGNNPARPDYRGSFTLDGKTYELAGWTKSRKSDGRPFISGSVKLQAPKADPGAYRPAEGATPSPRPARATPSPKVDDDDDIPF